MTATKTTPWRLPSDGERVLFFDIETDGLLEEATRVHCLVVADALTGDVLASCSDDGGWDGPSIDEGLSILSAADVVVAHNAVGFDMPALMKLRGWAPSGAWLDTLVMSRLCYPDIKADDFKLLDAKPGRLPGAEIGRHSLKAWGFRLGSLKGDFAETDDWSTWSAQMQRYCEQDVLLGVALWKHLAGKEPDARAVFHEHAVADIVRLQEQRGVAFDCDEAERLYAEIAAKREAIRAAAAEEGGSWFSPAGVVVPKRRQRRTNPETGVKEQYEEGAAYTRVKRVAFSPSSRQHVARLLQRRYGWKPRVMTPSGEPEISDDVLSGLDLPIAKSLAEYYMLEKRAGQLAEGAQAWLRLVRGGRIHGRVNSQGTPTGRAIHYSPNLAQCPSVSNAKGKVPYGREFRDLFRAGDGLALVGSDCGQLELRCLAHYLSRWDGGAYASVVDDGDVHWTNAKAFFGLDPSLERDDSDERHKFWRGAAKRIIYALMYGAGPALLGDIVRPDASEVWKAKTGRQMIKSFSAAIPAFANLRAELAKKVAKNRSLIGLDGRVIPVRSEHSALNFLLQSAGAVICKRWMIETRRLLFERGLVDQRDYWQVLWIHDEVEIETSAENAEAVGRACVEAARAAGEALGVRCPITGEYKVGRTWGDVH